MKALQATSRFRGARIYSRQCSRFFATKDAHEDDEEPEDRPVSVQPYFTITDRKLAAPITNEFLSLASSHPSTVHYGWVTSQDR